jgi:nucleoside-diphosphate-sugar epimerase
MKNIHAVTGAFGYTGKYISNLLLSENQKVITLTNSTNRNNEFDISRIQKNKFSCKKYSNDQ